MLNRENNRSKNELRPVKITRNFTSQPAGSVLIELGKTCVVCTASIVEEVPRWCKGLGHGWLTAEYSMLPASTSSRLDRESIRGRPSGRTQEISRLIGRALRTCINLYTLGNNTIIIDCDVLQADGSTRTASITGSYVALCDAISYMTKSNKIILCPEPPLFSIAAVSAGIINGNIYIDLSYEEDLRADVDVNIVFNENLNLVEIQGTSEGFTLSRNLLNNILDNALNTCKDLFTIQYKALHSVYKI